ncbi:MAG TPA: aminoglycoside phosphotransferase family protein, partial [Mycobacteriales bacterium]|nr:aminoglycoside phosphotransferase family protein [Mycobacteriales bacterium]
MVDGEHEDGRSGIDAALVRRLIAGQFPQWSELPITPVRIDGWDNRTYQLGDDMTVRLPSGASYAGAVEKEQRWLPILAPQLPLPIPEPLGRGVPAEGYPHHWSVYRWLDGERSSQETVDDLSKFAMTLADFLQALMRVDPTDGPPAGQHNWFRGGPLTTYDAETRQAIASLGDRIPGHGALAVWEAALAATWPGPPVWFHGDIAFGNLLVREGRLAAVIDFGTSGVGDPSCDLAITWTFFSGESRETFRAA